MHCVSCFFCHHTGKNGKTKNTPSKAGADRFIPARNTQQMDVASFLMSKENEPAEENMSAPAVRPFLFMVCVRLQSVPKSICRFCPDL